jgi:hypothetical protein
MAVRSWKSVVLVLAIAVALAAAMLALAGAMSRTSASASGMAADKAAMNGATPDVINPNDDTVVLSKTVKTSTVEDLMLTVTAECSIVTETNEMVNDSKPTQADGRIQMWITDNGHPVAVDPTAKSPDDGKVVFCNRDFSMKADQFGMDDNSALIDTFEKTRNANAFEWTTFNVGNGTHLIEVHARFDDEGNSTPACSPTPPAPGTGCSAGVVGKRTVTIEPTHFAHGATAEPVGP